MGAKICKKPTRSWVKILYAVVTGFLLLPLPVFAIDFSNVVWNIPTLAGSIFDNTNGNGGSITADNTTVPGHSILTFTTAGQAGAVISHGTTTITTNASSPGDITINNLEILKGTWNNLNNLSITNGQVAVSVSIQQLPGGPTNNMFSPAGYTKPTGSNPAPSGTTSITSFQNKTGSTQEYQVTVTFNFSTSVTVNNSAGVPFTLDFTTGP
jgi:hypothetical protein